MIRYIQTLPYLLQVFCTDCFLTETTMSVETYHAFDPCEKNSNTTKLYGSQPKGIEISTL